MTAIRYTERVYMPRWMLALMAAIAIAQAVAAAAVAITGKAPLGVAIALAAAAVLVAVTAYAMRYFEVAIDREGLRYGWAGFRGGLIRAAEAAEVSVVKYPWIYGYGWRVFGRTVCYSMPFERRALSVRKARGFFNRYLFTLKAPEVAAEALRAATAERADRQRR